MSMIREKNIHINIFLTYLITIDSKLRYMITFVLTVSHQEPAAASECVEAALLPEPELCHGKLVVAGAAGEY